MAKRFTDTEKWKKPFIRGLEAPYKLLWFYVCDDCDHAGIWQVDMDVAQIRIGETVSEKIALQVFGEKIVPIDGGNKWFIPSFIEFQYPSGLNPSNKAHGGIIQTLKKINLIDENFKPLTSPLQGAKDMDKDKDKVMDKDMEMDTDFGKSENLFNGPQLVPTLCRNWYDKFPTYTKDQKEDFQAMGKIVAFMVRQHSLTDISAPETREKIIATMDAIAEAVSQEPFWINKPLKSIANNIQEFYNRIKNPVQNGKGKGKQPVDTRADLQAAINQRFGGGQ